MATDVQHSPNLMDMPDEILLKILHCLFANWSTDVGNAGSGEIKDWGTEILGTYRLLNVEGTKAVRDQLGKCGLFNNNTRPPPFYPERYPELYARHMQLLKKYGDCIRKVVLSSDAIWSKFTLDWFPNLEKLRLEGSAYYLDGTKEDMVVVEGRLNKEEVLRLFHRQYRDFAETTEACPMDYDLHAFVWETTRGIDRDFTIFFEVELIITREMSWVSFDV